MITAAQCRAARGLLAWSQKMLATRSGIGLSTVRYLETGGREVGTDMKQAIRTTLEAAGVVFIEEDGGGPGVRLKRRSKT